MTFDQIILFALLFGVFALLIWGRWRYDVIAFAALVVALVVGVVPTESAFSGFGHPATVIIALVLVVSRGLINSGAVELIARYVGDFGANLYGATEYLDRVGRPQTPREIADLDFVGNADPERLMAPLQNMGIPVREENFVMSSESGVVAWEMTRSGLGISMQPEVLGDRDPATEKVFPSLPSPQFPVWLVTHRELQTSRRIRIVFDQIAHGLRETV